jgi:PAS domain S-box-containing protein
MRPETNRQELRIVDESAFDDEERLRLITSTTLLGTWDWNLLTNTLWYSPRLKAMLGYDDGTFPTTADEIGQLIHPDDRAARLDAQQRHWRTRQPYQAEYRLLHRDGSYRWYRACGESIWQPDGTPRRTAGATIDITDRKMAEELQRATFDVLQRSEDQFRSIIAHIPGTCFRMLPDSGWTPVFLSEGIERITGRPASAFMSQGMRYVDMLVHPDDVAATDSATRVALAERRPFTVEYRVVHQDGGIRWAHEEGQGVYDADGKLLHVDGVILDITQRKQAEEALRESEAKFASLVANIPGVCYRTRIDENWTMLFLSPEMEAISGYPPDAFGPGGTTAFVDVVHPEDREKIRQVILEAVDGHRPFQAEYRIVRPDGAVRWVLDRGQASFDADGNAHFQDGVMFDITESKEARQQAAAAAAELRDNEIKFRTLVENIPGVCYRCRMDDKLTVLYVSDGIERLAGYTAAQIQADRDHSFGGIIHSEDWSKVETTIRDALAKRQSFELEYRIVRADGSIRWVYDRGQGIFADDGTPIFQDGVLLDITERKNAEEKLNATEAARAAEVADKYEKLQCIIDNMADGVALFDVDMKLVTFNRRMVDMGELPPVFAQLGTLYEDLIRQFVVNGDYGTGDVAQILREKMAQARSGQAAIYEVARHDGRSIEVRRNPMPDGGVVLTYRDVTQHRTIEAQLRESQKLEALGQLAGGVAHEFNNLLTAIGGFSRLALKKQDDAERVSMCLGEVVKASERAADLTKQLLAFGRKQVLEADVVNVADIVHDLVAMLNSLLGEVIQLRIELANEPACVLADSTQLSQAILNLAINGRDAMPNGGRLTIGVDLVPPPAAFRERHPDCRAETCVVLRVSDTGEGINAETLPRIFEPFFTTKEQGKGTGLGLAVVYGMIEQSGGTIEVQSTVGKGTTFTICLPRSDGAAGAQAEEDAAPSIGQRRLVLVVDDERAVCDFTKIALLDLGYDVITASNAVDAVTAFNERDGAIDILLTDVVMPGQCGPDLARGLGAINPNMGVIFMSGYPERGANNGDVYRLPEGSAFIYKPFTPDAIGTLVGAVEGSRHRASPGLPTS